MGPRTTGQGGHGSHEGAHAARRAEREFVGRRHEPQPPTREQPPCLEMRRALSASAQMPGRARRIVSNVTFAGG